MNLVERATKHIESEKIQKYFVTKGRYRDEYKEVIYAYNKATGLKAILQKEDLELRDFNYIPLTCQVNDSTLFVTEKEIGC